MLARLLARSVSQTLSGRRANVEDKVRDFKPDSKSRVLYFALKIDRNRVSLPSSLAYPTSLTVDTSVSFNVTFNVPPL